MSRLIGAPDERVVIAYIRREIELLQAELTVAIPFIPLQG